jgi:integrase
LQSIEDAHHRAREILFVTRAATLDILGVDRQVLLDFLRWEATRKQAKPIPSLVEALLLAKEKKVSWAHLRDLRRILRGFAEDFTVDIDKPTRAEVEAWLDSRNVAPRTWNNNLDAIVTLYRFARREGHLSESTTPVERIQHKLVSVTIGTFSPEELAKILAVVPKEWLPAIVLGAFAGLRPEEICPNPSSGKPGICWENILWNEGQINVPKEVSKVRTRRLVPIQEAVIEFLRPWRHASGPVVPRMQLSKITGLCANESGVSWKSDGLRHSYASYRLAIIKDIHLLATEMGNSPKMIHDHYWVLKQKDEAGRWFALRPAQVATG